MDKLYVVVDASLPSGLKAAQACHALAKFAEVWEKVYKNWYYTSNNIVILEHDNPADLALQMQEAGHKLIWFREPDQNDEITAICVEPNAKRDLAGLKLAR